MDLLLTMSIFSSGADISREKSKAQQWMTAWVGARDDHSNKGAAAGQGKPPPQQQARAPQEEKKKLQGRRPWFAPEFDGLNCFETVVSH